MIMNDRPTIDIRVRVSSDCDAFARMTEHRTDLGCVRRGDRAFWAEERTTLSEREHFWASSPTVSSSEVNVRVEAV